MNRRRQLGWRVTGWAVGAAAVVGLALTLGTATRAVGDGDDTSLIHACVANRDGGVRIVGATESCNANKETAAHWSIQGPSGPTGATGPQGAQGPQGPPGVLGSYDQLEGLACTTAVGTPFTAKLLGAGRTPACAEGVSANGRFADLGRVVFDTQTGLTWEKKTNDSTFHDVDQVADWLFATGQWIGYLNFEGFAGYNDWRVPSVTELSSIVDTSVAGCGSGAPCIDPIFGPTAAAAYWSPQSDGAFAFVVFFDTGETGSYSKTSYKYVRAVRGP